MITVTSVHAHLQTAKVILSSGHRLSCVHGGAHGGPAVLMLHGLPDSWFSFSRALPLLPSSVQYVVPDQRGHGDSDRPQRGYTVDDFATDALLLMDALHLERATIIGHSLGSFVARRVAERAPHRVSRLVLVGTAFTARNAAFGDALSQFATLTDPVEERFIRRFQMSCTHAPLPDAFMTRIIAESRKVPARVWRAAAAGLWTYQPQWPLTVPTTIIGGQRDTLFSHAEQAALFHATERSALYVEPDIGHNIHWEAPERFAELAFREG